MSKHFHGLDHDKASSENLHRRFALEGSMIRHCSMYKLRACLVIFGCLHDDAREKPTKISKMPRGAVRGQPTDGDYRGENRRAADII